MSTLETFVDGFQKNLQSTTTLVKKPLTVSDGGDVSMLIETVSGKLVNITDPNYKDFCLEDIAWATSRISRFAGHTITEIPYNVAQHSVYVSELAEELFRSTENFNLTFQVKAALAKTYNNREHILLQALFHDAHEAYTGDIPSPVKKIPELQETIRLIEMKLDHAIRSQFNLEEPSEDVKIIIKYCDKLAQAIEGYQFMPSRGLNWNLPEPTLTRLQQFPQPKSAIESYKDFIFRYEYLIEQ